jgi:cytochrome bd ubiquinol oxidase subunit I
VVGDWATRAVSDQQPAKFAALEELQRTGPDAPLSFGPVHLPGALSLLLHGRSSAVVSGLDLVAPADQPPVAVPHYAFDTMVGIGFGLLALSGWALWRWWRRRESFVDSRWFLRASVAAGPAAVVALMAGWIATEVGRQPWIVHLVLRTRDAVSDQPGLFWYFYATVVVYAVLAVSLVAILRRLARAPMPTSSSPARPLERASR